TIYKMVRVDGEDPIEVWNKHNQRLENAFITLNDKQYTKLHLKAPGTDLEVGLPKGHIWHGGAAVSASNIIFNPNMPTEEVYTSPLNYGRQLIDEFQLTFKEGKVVDFEAKSGEEALKNLLDADEGARRLGEMALVPDASPISQSGLIFYNTLFDENASCHIALGKAYPTTVENGEDMSEEELDKNGINDSMVHVDFMIGSDKIDIDGIKADGTAEAVFRNGAWAFDI